MVHGASGTCTQVVGRRVYTVTGQHVPEEDIDRMIETGETHAPR